MELRGEQTEIHHNTETGLYAGSNATINIYLPSWSITTLFVIIGNDRDSSIHGEAPDDEDEGYEKNNNKIQEQNSTRSLPKKVLHFHSIYGLII